MTVLRALLAMGMLAGVAVPASAQQPPPLDVDRLPIDIERIARALRSSAIREERDGLNLRYTLTVYGQAPVIRILTKADNLVFGPVPYGAPTHREILQHITPQEFRSPVMDFGAAMRWLSGRLRGRSSGR